MLCYPVIIMCALSNIYCALHLTYHITCHIMSCPIRRAIHNVFEAHAQVATVARGSRRQTGNLCVYFVHVF